jgi:photosystem II stability/assembly factor-like uncharacterized protein
MKTRFAFSITAAILLTLAIGMLAGGGPALAQEDEWQEYPLPPGIQLTDFAFAGDSSGWASGIDNAAKQAVVWQTTDGGATWAEQFRWPEGGYYFLTVAFRDAQVGYVAGGKPVSQASKIPLIIRTEDGGATWQAATVPAESGMIYSLSLSPGGGMWARGSDFSWYYSPDGLSFTQRPITSISGANIKEIVFPTAQTGYAVGDVGESAPLALKTVDGGETWTELTLPLAEGFFDSA